MASSPENRQFEEDARKMVDDLAREDPDKLQELYKASQELQSIMKDNPEMFKSTFQDYIKKLEQGELQGPDIFGKGAPAPEPPKANPPKEAPASKPATNSTAAAPQKSEEKAMENTAEGDGVDYQVDDELWYAPTQKQKRPETVLARWSIACKKTKIRDTEDPGPPVYINVCESDDVHPLESHTGAVPCYTSEIVRNHCDICIHGDALAQAKFDPALKEDIVNLCLHKVHHFHKIHALDYTLGGPLYSVILGEVKPPKTEAPPAAEEHSEASPVQTHLPPTAVSNVEVVETDGDIQVHATLTVPSAKDVELTLIGRNSLRLQIPGVLPKDIALPCNVIEEEYTCKFMKKARTLKITLHKDMEGALD
uniref:PIH1D1/2/3 CS-like domain-containing protein n=1 Tax=Eutreptiella gymnastica TaxID=73025 RepID=A0A7S4GK17_9EUGL